MTQRYPVRHCDGSTDKRYAIAKEFDGTYNKGKPVWVARFCGDFIGSSISYNSALLKAVGHKSASISGVIVEQVQS